MASVKLTFLSNLNLQQPVLKGQAGPNQRQQSALSTQEAHPVTATRAQPGITWNITWFIASLLREILR